MCVCVHEYGVRCFRLTQPARWQHRFRQAHYALKNSSPVPIILGQPVGLRRARAIAGVAVSRAHGAAQEARTAPASPLATKRRLVGPLRGFADALAGGGAVVLLLLAASYRSTRGAAAVPSVFLEWDACLEALPDFGASPWGCMCGLPRHAPSKRWDLRSESVLMPTSVQVAESEEHGPRIQTRRPIKKEQVIATHDALLISPPPAGRAWKIPIRVSEPVGRSGSRDVDLHPAQYGLTVDCGDGKAPQHLFEGYMDLVPHSADDEVYIPSCHTHVYAAYIHAWRA